MHETMYRAPALPIDTGFSRRWPAAAPRPFPARRSGSASSRFVRVTCTDNNRSNILHDHAPSISSSISRMRLSSSAETFRADRARMTSFSAEPAKTFSIISPTTCFWVFSSEIAGRYTCCRPAPLRLSSPLLSHDLHQFQCRGVPGIAVPSCSASWTCRTVLGPRCHNTPKDCQLAVRRSGILMSGHQMLLSIQSIPKTLLSIGKYTNEFVIKPRKNSYFLGKGSPGES